jgi:hypothetical protein
MKFELFILGITGFFIANTYYDGKYVKLLLTWKKYYTMALWGFIGLSIYLFMKKHPNKTKDLFSHANKMVQYMPIDKDSKHLITPIFNLTDFNPQHKRMLNSGNNSTKRSVSETKKKYVAASQNWLCGNCKEQLPAWFEVDHQIRLDSGGTNHVDNLVALCRNCHGKKTAMENL